VAVLRVVGGVGVDEAGVEGEVVVAGDDEFAGGGGLRVSQDTFGDSRSCYILGCFSGVTLTIMCFCF
jgi:hypothetical protein